MRFALINNARVEPSSKQKGLCPVCAAPVTAKCGKQRIWHWAHDSKKICDHWWEPETKWHRDWKNEFPRECQEIIHLDEKSGEKHIADVKTSDGMVIEFQHSHLKPEERTAREDFYKNMIWVVDSNRLKGDLLRFIKGQVHFERTRQRGIFLTYAPEKSFSVEWVQSSKHVIFDFQGNGLWLLFSWRVGGYAIISEISRRDFVAAPIRCLYGLISKLSQIPQLQQFMPKRERPQRPFHGNNLTRGRRL